MLAVPVDDGHQVDMLVDGRAGDAGAVATVELCADVPSTNARWAAHRWACGGPHIPITAGLCAVQKNRAVRNRDMSATATTALLG